MKPAKALLIVILVLVVMGVLAFAFGYSRDVVQAPAPSEDGADEPASEPDADAWRTYANERYGFQLRYPADWQVAAASDDEIAPKFTFYKPAPNNPPAPFTHQTAGVTHVSVYPTGIPTEGLSGETVTSNVNFVSDVSNARDYVLADGTRFATSAQVTTLPTTDWRPSGFVFSRVAVENFTTECLRNGVPVADENCDPLAGDSLAYQGWIDPADRATAVAIMESLAFERGPEFSYKDQIRVTAPLPESTVSSPLVVRGQARGPWFFEASFPVILTDWDGRIIAEAPAQAQGEWMTENYVPFEATLTFSADTSVSDRGSLILQKANASGLPENADAFEYTLRLQESSASSTE